MKIKRIVDVITKEGLMTFGYLVKANLQAKQSADKKYKQWRKAHEQGMETVIPKMRQPFFSIVMLGNNHEEAGKRSLQLLKYDNWEVITPLETDTLKDCLDKINGSYVGFLCSGDCLAEYALSRMATEVCSKYNQDVQLFYSDEDMLSANGRRYNPFFKPDYSPDTLRSFFYMGGFLVIKKELLEKLVYCIQRPVEYGAYLLALEASFLIHDEQVCHIPEILYHRNDNVKGPDVTMLGKEKEALFRQYGVNVITEEVKDCGEARIVYELENCPKVSIIIPSKDNPSILQVCLDSMKKYTNYSNYEIVIVDNGSSDKNKQVYENLCREQSVSCRYYHQPMEFNFSRMCNIGAEYAEGEYYLFLNDDIEITKSEGKDWLTRLMGQAVQPHTGVVGAKLLYPNSNKIQHIGVVNYESGAAHILSKAEDDKPLLFGRNRMDYNYSVVTGACFLVSREKFQEVGGFSEELAVTFNDVELCFRILKKGYFNVVRNDVVLYHHESITRGEDAIDPKKYLRHLKEREKLFAMHPSFVKKDRYYSSNLTQKELDGAVNIEYKPDEFEVVIPDKETAKNDGEKMVHHHNSEVTCIIEYAEAKEQVCIRGFAFSENVKHNNLNKTYVVLKGKNETIYVKTMKIYNPTIAPQMESNKNLNFVEFYTSFSSEKLQECHYQIGVAVKTFTGKKIYKKMTDKQLKISGNC